MNDNKAGNPQERSSIDERVPEGVSKSINNSNFDEQDQNDENSMRSVSSTRTNEDSSDNSESSSCSGSDFESNSESNSESDEDTNKNSLDKAPENGMSEYERLRQERIRRNKAKLAQLGLDAAGRSSKNGSSSLLSPFTKTAKKRKRTPSNAIPIKKSTRERKTVNYSERNTIDFRGPSSQMPKKTSNPGITKGLRRPRFIYDELKRKRRERINEVKLWEKNKRLAEKEIRFACKQLKSYKYRKEKELKEHKRAESEAYKICLHHVLDKKAELVHVKRLIESRLCNVKNSNANRIMKFLNEFPFKLKRTQIKMMEMLREDYEMIRGPFQQYRRAKIKEKIESIPENKLVVISGNGIQKEELNMTNSNRQFESHPICIKISLKEIDNPPKIITPIEAFKDPPKKELNMTNSNRQFESDPICIKISLKEIDNPPKIITPIEAFKDPPKKELNMTNSNRQFESDPICIKISLKEIDNPPKIITPIEAFKDPRLTKIRRSVGGRIDTAFTSKINRSWLEGDLPVAPTPAATYIPQVGDTVLYYPSGHKIFLQQHEGNLATKLGGKNRDPIWKRDDFDEDIFFARGLGDLPILCKVKQTHIEFPPFKSKKRKKGKDKDEPIDFHFLHSRVPLPLIVTLKPLTELRTQKNISISPLSLSPTKSPNSPLKVNPHRSAKFVPPSMHPQKRKESAKKNADNSFTVTIFPSSVTPFIIPFVWAYKHCKGLSVQDCVRFRNKPYYGISMDEWLTGRITSISQNNCRDLYQSGLRGKQIPLQDLLLIQKDENAGNSDSKSQQKKLKLDVEDWPEWNSFVICIHGQQTHEIRVSPWELFSLNNEIFEQESAMKTRYAGIPRTKLWSSNNIGDSLVYTMVEPVRQKLEDALIDFSKKDSLKPFVKKITRLDAPDYYQVIPSSMYIEKMLQRIRRQPSMNQKSYCYYRSTGALMSDVSHIVNNCILYNNPRSEIVGKVVQFGKDMKNIIAEVEKIKEENRLKSKISRDPKYIQQINWEWTYRQVANSTNYQMQKTANLSTDSSLEVAFNSANATGTVQKCSPTKVQENELNKEYVKSKDIHRTDFVSEIVNDTMTIANEAHKPVEGETFRKFNGYQSLQPANVSLCNQNSSHIIRESLNDKLNKDKTESVNQFDECPVIEAKRIGPSANINLPASNIFKNQAIWSPQTGDRIFYHYKFHCQFLSFHKNSLNKNQQNPPKIPIYFSQNNWISGKIVRIRYLLPNLSEEIPLSFSNSFPIAAIYIQFILDPTKEYLVHWRPCVLDSVDLEKRTCPCCALNLMKSFLHPSWLPAHGIDSLTTTGILTCFQILRERCLNSIPFAFIDAYAVTAYIQSKAFEKKDHKRMNEPDASSKIKALSDSCFLAFDIKNENIVSPGLCLDLIISRTEQGYYRNRDAIKDDLYHTFSACAINIMKQRTEKITSTLQREFQVATKFNQSARNQLPQKKRKPTLKQSESNFATSPLPANGIVVSKANPKGKRRKPTLKQSESNFATSPLPANGIVVSKANSKGKKRKPTLKQSESNFATSPLPANGIVVSKANPKGKRRKPTLKQSESNFATSPLPANGIVVSKANSKGKKRKPTLKQSESNFATSPLPANGIVVSKANSKGKKRKPTLKQSESNFATSPLPANGIVVSKANPKKNAFKLSTVDLGIKARIERLWKLFSMCVLSIERTEDMQILLHNTDSMKEPEISSNALNLSLEKANNLIESVSNERSKKNSNLSLISPDDYENNETLTKNLFGKRNRRYPCVRCRAANRDYLSCRVKKGHTNPDFDLLEFDREGGIEKLLSSFKSYIDSEEKQQDKNDNQSQNNPVHYVVSADPTGKDLKENKNDQVVAKGDGKEIDGNAVSDITNITSGKSHDKAKNIIEPNKHVPYVVLADPTGKDLKENKNDQVVAKGDGKEIDGNAVSDITNVKSGKSHDKAKTCLENEPEPLSNQEKIGSFDDKTLNRFPVSLSTAGIVLDKENFHNLNASNKNSDAKAINLSEAHTVEIFSCEIDDEEEHEEMVEMAEYAFLLAEMALLLAKSEKDSHLWLDERFVREKFPIDETDNHYIYCIICGTSGDVLCCEGCPSVAHKACMNLENVPEGDWFCAYCMKAKDSKEMVFDAQVCKLVPEEQNKPPKPPIIVISDNEKSSEQVLHTMFEDVSGNPVPGPSETLEKSNSLKSNDAILARNKTENLLKHQVISNRPEIENLETTNPVTLHYSPVETCRKINESIEIEEHLQLPGPNRGSKNLFEKKGMGDSEKTENTSIINGTEESIDGDFDLFYRATSFMDLMEKLKKYRERHIGVELKPLKNMDDATKEGCDKVVSKASETSKDSPEESCADGHAEKVQPKAANSNHEEKQDSIEINETGNGEVSIDKNDDDDTDDDDDVEVVVKVGSKLLKSFDELGEFEGYVRRMPTKRNSYYMVRYTDGDEEDLSDTEVREHIKSYRLRQRRVAKEKKRKRALLKKRRLDNLAKAHKMSGIGLDKSVKKGRGRPRKSGLTPKISKEEKTVKRGRGRPRKADVAVRKQNDANLNKNKKRSAIIDTEKAELGPLQKKKKGRGRPRKSET